MELIVVGALVLTGVGVGGLASQCLPSVYGLGAIAVGLLIFLGLILAPTVGDYARRSEPAATARRRPPGSDSTAQ